MGHGSPNWTVTGSLDVLYLRFVPVEVPRVSTSHTHCEVSLLTAHTVSFVSYTLVRDQLQTFFLLYTMQLTTLALAAGLTLAAAQTTTFTSSTSSTSLTAVATSSACAAQPYALILPPFWHPTLPKSSTLTCFSLQGARCLYRHRTSPNKRLLLHRLLLPLPAVRKPPHLLQQLPQ
jgi:hypothetical protein